MSYPAFSGVDYENVCCVELVKVEYIVQDEYILVYI